jgi:hypothetical protein
LIDHDGAGFGNYITAIPTDAMWATTAYGWGDVLMFNNLTVHKAGMNRSKRFRLSADFRYAPSED